MRRVIVTVPPERFVSVDQAKQHLRVDGGDDDLLITAFIDAATMHIDGPDGWLGRAIGVQTLEAGLDGFVYEQISLPYPPTLSVEGIVYDDASGIERVLDPSAYEFRGGVIGSAWGNSWPTTKLCRGPSRSVRVTYRAGYETVPAPIVVAILMMVGDLYRFRTTASDMSMATSVIPMSVGVETLLQPYRVYRA
ncbi:head-tail connector protein [Sphingobium sp. YR768]|uniref:head-tail connector protein n=1 Tax=Sphingobium sp. YR768 TaxID=1884365 RepID=UPI0008C56553|nr:head-tail connector protein [Sphingobium sp. YR768]SEQ60379.1 phage conserved hypothetical protein, phiE125 gp8 family [Sphingobium sp. YR768]